MSEIRLLKASEIECRVGQCGKTTNGAWCTLLLYKDARCDMKIMDAVFGMYGWKKSYELINGNLFCTVSVRDASTGEWISKQDVGVESNTEKEKGQASDAFKRACVNIGIGRELYTAPRIFINLKSDETDERNGRMVLKSNCSFTVAQIGYDDERNINRLVIVDKNGVIRYQMGSKPVESRDEDSDITDLLSAYALPSIKQARSREELKRIWDDYPQLQGEKAFIEALNGRQNEISAAA